MAIQKKSIKTAKTTVAPRRARAAKVEAPAASAPIQVEAPAVTNEAIAARAYERFLARGCQHGHDVADWIEAERELRSA
jgi:hypothetical protein